MTSCIITFQEDGKVLAVVYQRVDGAPDGPVAVRLAKLLTASMAYDTMQAPNNGAGSIATQYIAEEWNLHGNDEIMHLIPHETVPSWAPCVDYLYTVNFIDDDGTQGGRPTRVELDVLENFDYREPLRHYWGTPGISHKEFGRQVQEGFAKRVAAANARSISKDATDATAAADAKDSSDLASSPAPASTSTTVPTAAGVGPAADDASAPQTITIDSTEAPSSHGDVQPTSHNDVDDVTHALQLMSASHPVEQAKKDVVEN